jgi:hypothetical protein
MSDRKTKINSVKPSPESYKEMQRIQRATPLGEKQPAFAQIIDDWRIAASGSVPKPEQNAKSSGARDDSGYNELTPKDQELVRKLIAMIQDKYVWVPVLRQAVEHYEPKTTTARAAQGRKNRQIAS